MGAKELPVSPLAPEAFPALPPVGGVRVAGAAIGLKKNGKPDLFLAELAPGSVVAGALTRSKCSSAPVDWCKRALKKGKGRAFVVNSGNANAFTGKAGDTTVAQTVKAAAHLFKAKPEEIYVASTGVIGQPVPPDHIPKHLPVLAKALRAESWKEASEAIRTTDTFAKAATRSLEIDGKLVTINGIAKGSGMIAPDMATMLCFVFTDCAITQGLLQTLVTRTVDRSFNCITVDSDTSTSDTVLVAATGAAGNKKIRAATEKNYKLFAAALESLMIELAQLVVKDGEGAQKFITIDVAGAVSAKSARRIGLAIANSPLIKTAIAGGDANWGRIVMAVGKAGEPADRDRLSIAMGGVPITRLGQIVKNYDETPVAAHIQGRDIHIEVDLGIGRGKARVWTCDLTHGYIAINADYRS